MTANARRAAGPDRRTLLGLALAGGVLAGCSGGDDPAPAAPGPATPTGTPTAAPTATGTPDAGTDPSFVPDGLSPTQRTVYRYGEHHRQVSDLWLPTGERRDVLLVVVHGGGWQAGFDRRDVNALVGDLVGRGYPVLNVDYRGHGDGGGWPSTFTDAATAVDLATVAASQFSLPVDRVCCVGHSAGGHLAMWAAARRGLPAGAPGADPRLTPALAASLSGVLNPTAAAGSDPNVVGVFGGSPAEVDDRFALGDPARLAPYGMPLWAGAGTADEIVPPAQTEVFCDAVRAAGDTVEEQLVPGADHGAGKDPGGPLVASFRAWLESRLG
ncbi:alpha/beta hydrolase family protein [Kineococcus sp. LSe6-4]|uniref:Alpha/beta hydrolase family protein n=1 Tax=Kineococcus halophytocola TaxID=3234027 RepID=A0ABV4H084_9ACTN